MHIGTRMVLLEYQRVFGSLMTKKKLAMPLAMPEKSEISFFQTPTLQCKQAAGHLSGHWRKMPHE